MVSGQACNPPDPHWYFVPLVKEFYGTRYQNGFLFLNQCGEWFSLPAFFLLFFTPATAPSLTILCQLGEVRMDGYGALLNWGCSNTRLLSQKRGIAYTNWLPVAPSSLAQFPGTICSWAWKGPINGHASDWSHWLGTLPPLLKKSIHLLTSCSTDLFSLVLARRKGKDR